MYKINIVAVDFDNTIDYGEYPDHFNISQHAINVLKEFQDRGGKVILWTCRASENDLDPALAHMKEHYNFIPDYVNCESEENRKTWEKNNKLSPKVYADLYIDDRNNIFREVDWCKIDRWLNLKDDEAPEPDWNKIRSIHDLESCTDYYELFECFGYDIIASADTQDYQGDSLILFRRTMPLGNISYGFLEFGWGSCSGCDAFQACVSDWELEQLAVELMDQIKWFYSEDEVLKFIKDRDWEGTHLNRALVDEFIKEVHKAFGEDCNRPMNIREEITLVLRNFVTNNEVDPKQHKICIFGCKKLEHEIEEYFTEFYYDEMEREYIDTYILYEGKLLGYDVAILLSDYNVPVDGYVIKSFDRNDTTTPICIRNAGFMIERNI